MKAQYARGATHLWMDDELLERGYCMLSQPASMNIKLSSDDLRWLCMIAGPALLNELAKQGEGDES